MKIFTVLAISLSLSTFLANAAERVVVVQKAPHFTATNFMNNPAFFDVNLYFHLVANSFGFEANASPFCERLPDILPLAKRNASASDHFNYINSSYRNVSFIADFRKKTIFMTCTKT